MINKWTFTLFLTVAVLAIFYNNPFNIFKDFINSTKEGINTDKTILKLNELKQYNGVARPQLYLAILGHIFDVTTGADKYGPGKSYNFFIGQDASRNFINGKFTQLDASDKVDGFNEEEFLSLDYWLNFYQKNYKRIGVLQGTYFDEIGEFTSYKKEIQAEIEKARKAQEKKQNDKALYPPCNVEWSEELGTRVWCTNMSGGVKRDWSGFPRQLFQPGTAEHRCACVPQTHLAVKIIKPYKNCPIESLSCLIN